MERWPVVSTLISEIGYDADTRTLEVEFKRGRLPRPPVWRYHDVPPEIHERLLTAESPGRYFFRHVRGNYQESDASPEWYSVEMVTVTRNVTVMQVLASSEEEAARRAQDGAEELRVVGSSEPEHERRIGEVRRLRPI